ncbi:hypothetical protein OGAPHI_005705 [Ogataea philodendri]|uniref:Uncharacterized protein n=1 Tax=Ogataea philodendri TaxID=1378263 RepID=A0A9P8NYA3_9ASCO|nr:uncharacterized protein OGAPHI_005705 [Ogataea philodendri]KAH3662453.1 hypothetical protein OGAPHI_005705 [Ogataea philodendri]
MVRINALCSNKYWALYALAAHMAQTATVNAVSVQYRAQSLVPQIAGAEEGQHAFVPAQSVLSKRETEQELEVEAEEFEEEEVATEEYVDEEDIETVSESVEAPEAEALEQEEEAASSGSSTEDVKDMIDLYVTMGKEKFAGFLATCSPNHFREAVKALTADATSKKEVGSMGRLSRFLETTDDYLKHNAATDLFRNTFKGKEDVEKFRQLEKADSYCAMNEEECNEEIQFQQQNVENSSFANEYKSQARRRSKLIQLLLKDAEEGKDMPVTAAEFQYREGNIFLDQDDNEYRDLSDECESDASHLHSRLSTLVAFFMVVLLI